jgi:hypothetical protein
MSQHPVVVELSRPERYDRVQLLLRLALAVLLGCVGVSLGWVMGVSYLGLPVFAAAAISARGGERYMNATAPALVRLLRWVLAFYAYMMLLVDRFPAGEPYEGLRVEVSATGQPTVRGALWRLVRALPAALLFLVLAIVGGFVWLIAAVSILISERYSAALYDYQCGVFRLQARLLAYLASVVADDPPLAFDAGPVEAGTAGSRSPA